MVCLECIRTCLSIRCARAKGNLAGVPVNPIALDALQWKYYIFYCAFIAFELACIYFLFPETSRRTIEQISEIFDGSRQEVEDVVEQINLPEKNIDQKHIGDINEDPKYIL
jgi:hypothetical protein